MSYDNYYLIVSKMVSKQYVLKWKEDLNNHVTVQTKFLFWD